MRRIKVLWMPVCDGGGSQLLRDEVAIRISKTDGEIKELVLTETDDFKDMVNV